MQLNTDQKNTEYYFQLLRIFLNRHLFLGNSKKLINLKIFFRVSLFRPKIYPMNFYIEYALTPSRSILFTFAHDKRFYHILVSYYNKV